MRRSVIEFADAMTLARDLGEGWTTAADLVSVVAARRGRRIDVAVTDLTGTGITGTVLAGRETDTILHASGLPPFFTEHVIFHELSHLLCGHLDGPAGGSEDRGAPSILRHHQDTEHEREAELLATAFAQLRSERDRGRSPARFTDDGGFAATLAPHLLPR